MVCWQLSKLQIIALVVALAFLPRCQSFSSNTLGGKQRNDRAAQSSLLAKASPQVLEFQEPSTGVTVKLVGCMHYNPASIQTTEYTINELAKEDRLGSVVIESCDIRWNKTKELPQAVQNLLQSEMKAACDLAGDTYQRPVVLGDQRINVTVSSLKRGFQETFVDLATPFNGGWGRLFRNVTEARVEAAPFGKQYLSPLALFDPRLVLAAPVSLIKYPLSYFFRSPIGTTIVLTLLFLLDSPPDPATVVTMDRMTAGDWVGSLVVSVVEIALFARVFLKELLAERNEILARNILEQCKLYQSNGASTAKPFWSAFGSGGSRNSGNAGEEIYYVDGSTSAGSGKDRAVVAVLGMAHCNGIAKLLKEQKV